MTELATRGGAPSAAAQSDSATREAARPPVPAVAAFRATVRAVRRLSPHFLRITFGGNCLRDFGVAGDTLDLRIKLVIPPAGSPGADIGKLMAAPAPEGWYQRWLALDPAARGVMRTYTVRESRSRDNVPELDVDFVLHADADGHSGPASRWAAEARAGDALWLIGPNVHAARCATAGAYGGIEWRPGLAQRVLLAGDETAVPAISAILAAMPPDMTGHAFLEVPGAEDIQQIRTDSRVEVLWLPRDGKAHGEVLSPAVRSAVTVPAWAGLGATHAVLPYASGGSGLEDVDVDQAVLWETPERLVGQDQISHLARPPGALPFYAWIAGEAAAVRELRRYLVREAGMDRRQVAFMGYWRRGKADLA